MFDAMALFSCPQDIRFGHGKHFVHHHTQEEWCEMELLYPFFLLSGVYFS